MPLDIFGGSLDIFGVLKVSNDGTVTTIMGPSGDYNRIGDAGTTAHSLDSEDDLMVTGEIEVKGVAWLDSDVKICDNKLLEIGSGTDTYFSYATNDTNAKALHWVLPRIDLDGSNVPVVAACDISIYQVDLGLFDGMTQPTIAMIEKDAKYASATDATADTGNRDELGDVGAFAAAVVGDIIRIISGTNVTAAWYWITDVSGANDSVTLDRDFASGNSTNVAYLAYHDFTMLSADGICTRITDGAPDDDDVEIDRDGWIILDAANSRLYWRAGNGWHYAAQDAGFEVNKDDKNCPVCGELIEVGQAVVGQIDKVLDDGARHGEWCHLNCLN